MRFITPRYRSPPQTPLGGQRNGRASRTAFRSPVGPDGAKEPEIIEGVSDSYQHTLVICSTGVHGSVSTDAKELAKDLARTVRRGGWWGGLGLCNKVSLTVNTTSVPADIHSNRVSPIRFGDRDARPPMGGLRLFRSLFRRPTRVRRPCGPMYTSMVQPLLRLCQGHAVQVAEYRRSLPTAHAGQRHRLCPRLHRPGQGNTRRPWKPTRQQAFVRALETLPEIKVTYGSFLASPKKMPLAPPRAGRQDDHKPEIVTLQPGGPTGAIVLHTEEKGSDVNIATRLVADAHRKRFKAAAVLSVEFQTSRCRSPT